MYGNVERLTEQKKAAKKAKQAVHQQLLQHLQSAGVANWQVAQDGDMDSGAATLQVSVTKYYKSESLLKDGVLAKADINWEQMQAPAATIADRVEHVFQEIQKARKSSAPLVKVHACGKVNRGKLPFIRPETQLQQLVLNYDNLQQRVRELTESLDALVGTDELQAAEQAAIDHFDQRHLKRQVFNIQNTQWVLKKTQTVRARPPTVVQLKDCIRQTLEAGLRDKTAFILRLSRLLQSANAPVTVTSTTFEPVKQASPKAPTVDSGGIGASSSSSSSSSAGHGGKGHPHYGAAQGGAAQGGAAQGGAAQGGETQRTRSRHVSEADRATGEGDDGAYVRRSSDKRHTAGNSGGDDQPVNKRSR